DESLEPVRERAQGPGTGYRCRAEDPVDPVVAAQRGGLGTDGEPGLLEVAQVAGPAGEDIDGVEVAGEGRIDRLLRPVHPVGAGMDARRVADRDEEAGGGALVIGDGVDRTAAIDEREAERIDGRAERRRRPRLAGEPRRGADGGRPRAAFRGSRARI